MLDCHVQLKKASSSITDKIITIHGEKIKNN